MTVFIYAAVNLFLIWQEYRQGEALYDAAQVEFLTAPEMELEFESDKPITWPTFTIDFGHLQDVNNASVGLDLDL